MDANRTKPGNQAFAWLGWNKKFTKPGQLTAVRSGSTIIIRGNTDGNPSKADFEIQIDHYSGPGPLNASNFIL
jgi:hypothetical protein